MTSVFPDRRPDDLTRFDAAKAQAKAVLEKSNPGDGYSLILVGSPAQVIVPGPADDRDKVAREVDELKLPHGSSDVAGGLHAAAEMVSKPLGKYARREVYIVTDLRKSAWPLPVGGARSAMAMAGSAAAPAIGRSTQKVLPSLWTLWNPILPPISSVSFLVSDRPMPVPSIASVSAPRRLNGTNSSA